MIEYDYLAVFFALNVIAYLIVHIPLGVRSILSDTKPAVRKQTSLKEFYTPLKFSLVFPIIVLTTVYFFIIFLFWPFYHLLFGSEFLVGWLLELPYSTSFQFIGIVLITAATMINILGRIARGKSYISDGVPDELSKDLGHKVVRHPLYASYCYYFVGFQLVFQSYLTLPLLLGVFAYYSASKHEERVLEREFREEYREYQKRVGMLLPFVGMRK